jgi:ornithine carbamoyltransferase
LSSLKGRSLLSLTDFSIDEIILILDLADKFKDQYKKKIFKKPLENKNIALLFQKPSTRTRISFEVAIRDLGGHSIYLSSNDLQLVRGESIHDTAKVLSRYVDAIIARVKNHEDIIDIEKHSSIPVINGLSELYHPTQVLADLQTIRENKKRLSGLKIAWIGDCNNVCNSMLIACSKSGIDLSVASPSGHNPSATVYKAAKEESSKTGSEINLTDNPVEAATSADVVITDTFISMNTEKDREEILKMFLPKFQVNRNVMSFTKPDAIFMHCLPAFRGEEVTSEIIDGPTSVVWDEAENRRYIQQALLDLLL